MTSQPPAAMAQWETEEDARYSWLYSQQYGHGEPAKLVAWMGLGRQACILDAGCGAGELCGSFDCYCGFDVAAESIRLARQRFRGAEFHHLGLTAAPDFFRGRRFDAVLCNDVLEHVPTDQVAPVLDALSRLPAPLHVFSISTRPSRLLDRDGRGLHLTVRPPEWWLDQFRTRYRILRVSDLDAQQAFYTALGPLPQEPSQTSEQNPS